MVDPLEYLFSLEQFGIKLGLENIRALCRALGDPQQSYRSLIVAGTNGKGSVTAMVDRALNAHGYRTGRYTSPHLIKLEERFAINGRQVEEADVRITAQHLKGVIDRLRESGELEVHPTFFEVTTAMAFEMFRRASVDLAVLEVGLGGRFDATNVATPKAAAITSIDFDHERHLGRTIAAIAFEKAGVIKPGMVVVTGETKREALDVFERACRERDARLVRAQEASHWTIALTHGKTNLRLRTARRDYRTLPLSLNGRHQALNALVAVRLLEEIEEIGISVSASAIETGLTATVWPGRLQTVRTPAGVAILDAAHNPAGARVLAEYLGEIHPEKLPIVFGAMHDKDVAGILAALAPVASTLILTEADTPRRASAADLLEVARDLHPDIVVEPRLEPALAAGWSRQETLCVTGSIFLIGDVLKALQLPDSRG